MNLGEDGGDRTAFAARERLQTGYDEDRHFRDGELQADLQAPYCGEPLPQNRLPVLSADEKWRVSSFHLGACCELVRRSSTLFPGKIVISRRTCSRFRAP